ncbi:Mobile element protein [uncultured Candidatus Thioglobus sp.]|nr:Mobile element protein [uncultured Candidatus Thioglobus sp.]
MGVSLVGMKALPNRSIVKLILLSLTTSWERGLNENHNSLLRQFFPKQIALDKASEKEAFRVTDLMNNRPRKCLGWKTPFEVFAQLTGKDYFLNGSVALMG